MDTIGLFFLLIGMACCLYAEEFMLIDHIILARYGGTLLLLFGFFRIIGMWHLEHPDFLLNRIFPR